ncbi:unnamed protein product [Lathyrus sativus]|nr:unnamed protein product [Lathyrus sativus]
MLYSFSLSHINGQDMWPKVDTEEILSPTYNRGPGRSKKLIRREPDEDPNKVRSETNYCCIRCGVHGHNARSCTSQVVDLKANKCKRKPKKTASGQGKGQGHSQTQTTSV